MNKKLGWTRLKSEHPEAFDAWVKGLIDENQHELFITDDGRPGYRFSVDGYDGQCIWQPKEGYFEEEYPEDE